MALCEVADTIMKQNQPQFQTPLHPQRRSCRGMALFMVVSVIGVATVLGLAVLGESTTNAILSENAARQAQAEYLSESGVQLAMFYLCNPDRAPAGTSPNGFYTGEQGLSLGSNLDGTVDVSVSLQGSNFVITSVGTAQGQATGTMTTTVKMAFTQKPKTNFTKAVSFVADGYFPAGSHVTGDVEIGGWYSRSGLATITGAVTYAHSMLHDANSSVLPPTQTVSAPSQNISNFSTYTYQGGTYSGQQLASNNVLASLGATVSNPGGVYYATGDVTLNTGVTINGTLRVINGNLIVKGAGITVTAQQGMPAVVVDKQIKFSGNSRSLGVQGVCWAGTGVGPATASCTLSVNGALSMPTGATVPSNFQGQFNLTYDSSRATLSQPFSSDGEAVPSVCIVQWNNQGQ